MYPVILSGGIGTRLWPLSRKTYPKQFLKLLSNEPLIVETIERIKNINKDNKTIIVVSNKEYKFLLDQILIKYKEYCEIIVEPVNKSTLPAIILAVKYLKEKYNLNNDEIIAVFPSDHYISPLDKFQDAIYEAQEIAKKNYIVTLGIKPVRVDTNYGYIEVGDKIGKNSYLINSFYEKPTYEKAKSYISSGNYCWNSGIFFFPICILEEELEKYDKDIYNFYNIDYNKLQGKFNLLPEISIDYAIMEKTKKSATVISDIIWSDLGTWDSLYEILDKDNNKNAVFGDVLAYNVKESLIWNKENNKFLVNINCKDLVVVNTDDVLLIAKKGSNQIFKNVFNFINQNRKELTSYHSKSLRPWGSYKILEESKNFKVKRITVLSHAQLSLQLHKHRCEHWIIVDGEGEVTIDDNIIKVNPNDNVFIPKESKHRIKNNSNEPLIFIEVQFGDNLDEDDIVRFEDIYGRH